MTVLGALAEDDRIIIASDSLVTNEDGSTRLAPKLWFLPDAPVAWGFSGDDDVGLPFVRWLKERRPPVSNWVEFRTRVVETLRSLNAGKPLSLRAEVLLVAWADGAPRYLHVHKTASPPTEGAKWCLVGSGGPAAMGELAKLDAGGTPWTWRLLRAVIAHAASPEIDNDCGPPLQAFEVDRHGARKFELFVEGDHEPT